MNDGTGKTTSIIPLHEMKWAHRDKLDRQIGNASGMIQVLKKDENYSSVDIEDSIAAIRLAHDELGRALETAVEFEVAWGDF